MIEWVRTILVNNLKLYSKPKYNLFFFENLHYHNKVCLFLYQNKKKISQLYKNLKALYIVNENYKIQSYS